MQDEDGGEGSTDPLRAFADMPRFTLFRAEPADIISELDHSGVERRVNISLRTLVIRGALLTEEQMQDHSDRLLSFGIVC